MLWTWFRPMLIKVPSFLEMGLRTMRLSLVRSGDVLIGAWVTLLRLQTWYTLALGGRGLNIIFDKSWQRNLIDNNFAKEC